jgi:hypothetical protein
MSLVLRIQGWRTRKLAQMRRKLYERMKAEKKCERRREGFPRWKIIIEPFEK